MSVFIKIEAKNGDFITCRERFYKPYNDFINYLNNVESNKKGSSVSGKPRSYANYLIRLVMIYENKNNQKLNDLDTLDTFEKLNSLRCSPEFKKYNSDEGHFPGSTLASYGSFIMYRAHQNEKLIDDLINEELAEEINVIPQKKDVNLKKPKDRAKKIKHGSRLVYMRDKNESLEAKRLANWQCENDNNHQTFNCESNGKPYMEAHHLIPMAVQDLYENTIDFADNIVCLCPTCHMKIHHGEKSEKKKLIRKLYSIRETKYPHHGIAIEIDDLLEYYL